MHGRENAFDECEDEAVELADDAFLETEDLFGVREVLFDFAESRADLRIEVV